MWTRSGRCGGTTPARGVPSRGSTGACPCLVRRSGRFCDRRQRSSITPSGSAAEPGVDRLPVAEPLRRGAALAAAFHDLRQRVNEDDVRDPHVAALNRQAGADFGAMFCCDLFHDCAPLDCCLIIDKQVLRAHVDHRDESRVRRREDDGAFARSSLVRHCEIIETGNESRRFKNGS